MPLIGPSRATVRPPSRRLIAAPIRASSSTSSTPGWVVCSGHPGTVTDPPAMSAAAKNGAAFDRSGSTTTSRARTTPGSTRQDDVVSAEADTPACRSRSRVISMCGRDGTAREPVCSTVRPSSNRAAASRSPDTNWDDAEASTRTSPPRTCPVPATVNGRLGPP